MAIPKLILQKYSTYTSNNNITYPVIELRAEDECLICKERLSSFPSSLSLVKMNIQDKKWIFVIHNACNVMSNSRSTLNGNTYTSEDSGYSTENLSNPEEGFSRQVDIVEVKRTYFSFKDKKLKIIFADLDEVCRNLTS